jgi:hypothetical protein
MAFTTASSTGPVERFGPLRVPRRSWGVGDSSTRRRITHVTRPLRHSLYGRHPQSTAPTARRMLYFKYKPDAARLRIAGNTELPRPVLDPSRTVRTPQARNRWTSASFISEASSVSRAQKRRLQSSLSLLLSNLSSTNSKASGPTRTSPEKGCSKTPIVKSTEEINKANAATISLCTSVFSKPNM